MSTEQLEFIKACQNAQDEAYRIGDLDLALSWSTQILDALRQWEPSPEQTASEFSFNLIQKGRQP